MIFLLKDLWLHACTHLTDQQEKKIDSTENYQLALMEGKFNSDHGRNWQFSGLCTSIISKVMESLVRDHIMNHMLTNPLLFNYQFGFVHRISTVLQLLQVLEECIEILDSGIVIDMCYMDFMKAVDTVPHKKLISI